VAIRKLSFVDPGSLARIHQLRDRAYRDRCCHPANVYELIYVAQPIVANSRASPLWGYTSALPSASFQHVLGKIKLKEFEHNCRKVRINVFSVALKSLTNKFVLEQAISLILILSVKLEEACIHVK